MSTPYQLSHGTEKAGEPLTLDFRIGVKVIVEKVGCSDRWRGSCSGRIEGDMIGGASSS
jgi:hypothetical protein